MPSVSHICDMCMLGIVCMCMWHVHAWTMVWRMVYTVLECTHGLAWTQHNRDTRQHKVARSMTRRVDRCHRNVCSQGDAVIVLD